MTATTRTPASFRIWVIIPYGMEHTKQWEELAGINRPNPDCLYASVNWDKLLYRGGRPVNGYGFNGVYLEVWKLPDTGHILIRRTDKYGSYSKFMLFADAADYDAWVKEHNDACPEIDPETGRRFIR